MQGKETYSLEKTIEFPNMVARIYRPALSEEEKNKRLQKIKTATANLIIGVKK